MAILISFIRSLLLTIVFGFALPIIFVGALFASFTLIGHIPGLQTATSTLASIILEFLATFGSGAPIRGLITIALTCAFVAGLFDTYVHYRYQILRLDS